MEAEPRDEVVESSEDETDAFDNYGVFQSDYEFKFVQEGNDKTTLMLPPVTYDSMEVKFFNIEIEVDSELHVSTLEKEKTTNGTTRYFFRIAKQGLNLEQTDEVESVQQLGEDGYEYGEMTDEAIEKSKKQKSKKSRTPMDAHNYSKPKVTMSSAPELIVQEITEKSDEKKTPKSEQKRIKVEALDGTQIDQDASGLVEFADVEEEMDEEAEYNDDDGDDDLDDFDETEIAGNMTLEDEGDVGIPKRKVPKVKTETPSESKRKYNRTNHYSKDSSNFTVELTDEGEKYWKCGFCEHTSRFVGNMCDHVRTHTGEKPFTCDICEVSFKRADALRAHLIRHTDEKNCMCEICGTFFKSKKSVYNHTLQVHREKKYKCHYCGKSFSNNFHLNQHIIVHTGEKKHTCKLCNVSVSSISSLKRHMLTHTGEQKFQCHVCAKGFNRKEYFRDHMIKSHDYTGMEDFLAKSKRSKMPTYSPPVFQTVTLSAAPSDENEGEVYTLEEVVMSVIKEEEDNMK